MRRGPVVLTCAAALVAALPHVAQAAVPTTYWQLQAGEDEQRGLVDLLVPLHVTENQVWLLNPRYSLDDDSEEELNVGLVYRCLLPDLPVILGANLYYDSRWTRRDSHFSQVGAGVEALSRWLDFRANYYLPEHKEVRVDSFYRQEVVTRTRTIWSDPYARKHQIRQKGWRITESTVTTRLFERFEQAREGYDCELGFRLPIKDPRLEVRVFGGYYHWDPEYVGESDLSGPKARLEVRLLPALFLDAQWFEDKELEGSRWMAGCRVRLNCDLAALARGENPFKHSFSPQSTDLRSRLYGMVIRDPKIRTADSGYRENPAAATTTVQVSRRRIYHTLLDDVNFVNGDYQGAENGTAEHPYTSIQTAVDNAFGQRNVYVYAASTPYQENVVLRASTTIIGQGYPLRGRGGKTFGGDRHPLLDGRGSGPTVSMADNSALYGMHIINTDTGGPALQDPVYGIWGYEVFGVYAGNVSEFYIGDNLVENCGRGMVLVCNADRDFDFQLHDNVVRNTEGGGLLVMGEAYGRRSTIILRGNQFLDIDGAALDVQLAGYRKADFWLEDTSLVGSTDIGGFLSFMDTGNTTLRLSNLQASRNSAEGLFCIADVTGRLSVALADITAWSNAESGLALDLFTEDDLVLAASGIDAAENGSGIDIQAAAVGQNQVSVNDILATGNGRYGLGVIVFSFASDSHLVAGENDADASASSNITITDNANGAFLMAAAGSNTLLALNGMSLSDNTNVSLEAYALAAFGDAVAVLNHVRSRGGLAGSSLTMDADTLCAASIAYSRFVESGGHGLEVEVGGSNLTVYMQNTVLADNLGDGLRLSGTPGTTTDLDLGGGTLGSPGWNSIYANGGVGVNNLLPGVLADVRGNYWGGAAPVAGSDYSGANDPGVDWLATDPNP